MREHDIGSISQRSFLPSEQPSAERLTDLCAEIRRRMLELCLAAETGHVGGCSGAVELFTSLYFGGALRYDVRSPASPDRDRVLVRGHLGPVRYAIFSLLGWVEEGELAGYATLGSRLQGHETPDLPGVDFGPSGSLGMLLSYGVGSAIVAASSPSPWRTFVFLGDGEEQEGNVAEAARHAVSIRARGLIAIVDANGYQLSGPTGHADTTDLSATWRGYGWKVIELADGNKIEAVTEALRRSVAMAEDGPAMIVAATQKGYGIPGADAHFSGYHELGHADPAVVRDAVRSLHRRSVETGVPANLRDDPLHGATAPAVLPMCRRIPPPRQSWPDHPDAFQIAYFTDLAGNWDEMADGPLHFLFADTFPEPLLDRTGLALAGSCKNVGIREQHLVALAHAISQADPRAAVIAHTGDPFILRAMDQLLAAASVGSRFVLIGDDAGITNARNGASHQSSAHPLLLNALDGIECFEPADGHDFAAVMGHALSLESGICYVRVHDGVLSKALDIPPELRAIGWYQARTPAGRPDVLLAASGFMTGQAIGAADLLASEDIRASVVNVVQPSLAGEAVAEVAAQGVPVLTVYDGLPAVLGNPVLTVKAKAHLPFPVRSLGFSRGTSGRLDELLTWAGLDSGGIARSALALLGEAERELTADPGYGQGE